MKNQIVSSILLVTILSQLGCASVPKKTVNSLSEIQFQKNKRYEIKMTRNEGNYRLEARGDQIERQEDGLLVKQAGGDVVVRQNEIQQITTTEGNQMLRGLWMGALVGLGVGGIVSGVTAAGLGDCNNSGDPGDCEAIRDIVIFLSLTGTPIFGSLIGLAVGAGIPKKSSIQVAPTFSQSNGEIRAGVGLSKSF